MTACGCGCRTVGLLSLFPVLGEAEVYSICYTHAYVILADGCNCASRLFVTFSTLSDDVSHLWMVLYPRLPVTMFCNVTRAYFTRDD